MSSQTTEPDPYAILGVAPETPFKEIRAAHRRLILELHPDVNPGAREHFDAVQIAFEMLRGQHDRARARGARPSARLAGEDKASDTGPLSSHGQTATIVEAAPRRAPEIPEPGGPALRVVLTPGRESLLLQPRAQMMYVLLDLKLSQETRSSTQPLNLSLVLDHSSSMQRDDKLQRLKEAVSRIIDMMEPHDYLSIVTFGDRATVLLPSSPLGDKHAAKEALDAIRCRGGTEISTGIRAGLQELQTHSANLLSQMLVLTDGQTYGDEAICLALATQAGERQVQITALGLGDDWNSTLLDELALRTSGHSDYVQSAEQLTRVFEEQLRTLQLTAIRNLTLTVNAAISSRLLRATWVAPSIKLLPVPADPAPGAQAIELDLGRVSMDRDYRLLLELVVAARTPGTIDVAEITFAYEVPGLGRNRETTRYTLSTTFVEKWVTEPPVHQRVHDALRKITAHRLQEQAMQAIQDGQTQKGTASLRTAANHLEAAGSLDLAALARAEADRIERQGQAQAGNMKRIIYGTRGLG
ncbi:MAG TPA: VWA domain-containing protein [Chloroflexota bacterium]|nr:VWA domain-containing protein [Chloroflexota bacterium]